MLEVGSPGKFFLGQITLSRDHTAGCISDASALEKNAPCKNIRQVTLWEPASIRE